MARLAVNPKRLGPGRRRQKAGAGVSPAPACSIYRLASLWDNARSFRGGVVGRVGIALVGRYACGVGDCYRIGRKSSGSNGERRSRPAGHRAEVAGDDVTRLREGSLTCHDRDDSQTCRERVGEGLAGGRRRPVVCDGHCVGEQPSRRNRVKWNQPSPQKAMLSGRQTDPGALGCPLKNKSIVQSPNVNRDEQLTFKRLSSAVPVQPATRPFRNRLVILIVVVAIIVVLFFTQRTVYL